MCCNSICFNRNQSSICLPDFKSAYICTVEDLQSELRSTSVKWRSVCANLSNNLDLFSGEEEGRGLQRWWRNVDKFAGCILERLDEHMITTMEPGERLRQDDGVSTIYNLPPAPRHSLSSCIQTFFLFCGIIVSG